MLASETCALDIVGAELVRDIRPGEIVVVDDDGYRIDTYTDQTQLAICSMEFIYFARPDSNIYGVNVHSARKRMGARLAQESPVDADMVIAVPNSSLSAASGYSEGRPSAERDGPDQEPRTWHAPSSSPRRSCASRACA